MSEAQGQLRLTALLACCVGVVLGWQLCLFPPGQASPLVGTFLNAGQTTALNVTVMLANALGAGAFLALFPRMLSAALPSGCAAFAAAAQALAFAVLALLSGMPAALVAGLLLGLSIAAWWCALTLFIARLDVEMAEKTFVFALPLCGAGALLPQLTGPLAAVPFACLAAPAAALALLFFAGRVVDAGCGGTEKSTWGTERPGRADLMPTTRLGGTLLQALAAYLCISLYRPDNPLLDKTLGRRGPLPGGAV